MSESNIFRAGATFGGGRFVLIRLLGRGGMGEVWLARDQRLEEQVALKFLLSKVSENPPTLEHLRLETARSHRLSHPNIVRLHDFHEPPGEPAFISMEYVDGHSLNALRVERAGKVLPWDYLRQLLADLCAALEYAHAEEIIHRDLKPDNILVDSRGRVKLTDFGLAAMASDMARHGSKIGGGTLHYMSPQQLEGRHPQITDDIYALGASLYELLTSQPPFCAENMREQILHEPPEPLEQRLAALGIENEIRPDLAAMVMGCLSKDPEQRPQSARTIAEWLRSSSEAEIPREALVPNEVSAKSGGGRGILWMAGIAVLFLLLVTAWLFKKPSLSHHWPGAGRWTNSLGMIFVPVPESEAMFSVWLTRVQDYQVMADETGRSWKKPKFEQGPTHPAVNIKWDDAVAFCKWLTDRERGMGMINSNQSYRLPMDAEWSLAVGLGHENGDTPEDKDQKIQGVYPWGTEWPPPRNSGNFDPRVNVDDFPYTSPVGSFDPNSLGLYDMAGNAREWCQDLYAPGSHRRSVRGSAWFDAPAATLLSSRRALTSVERHDNRYDFFGFRCVFVPAAK